MRGMGNMQGMMKKMQKMQKEMMEAQEALNAQEFEGAAGGGMVKATVNGKNEIVNLELSKDVVDAEDIEMLQDLIIAAVNEAQRSMQAISQEKMSAITGGMNIPGL